MGPIARFICRRLLISLTTLVMISMVSFVIIQLPPGDFVSSYIAQLEQAGAVGSGADAERLREAYGLDRPMYVRYGMWAWDALHGNFGRSLDWGRPVSELIGERMGLTLLLCLGGLVLPWIIAFPIGLYCASHRGSLGDYT